MNQTPRIGFIGLGAMGEPMALNLVKAGTDLVVWNRSAAKRDTLAAAGARAVETPASVFAAADIVFLMLSDGAAMDAVLMRGTPSFAATVRGRTIVSTATVAPAYSRGLEADLRAAGAPYVEAPVSGSRAPAVAGQLVAMLAGDPAAIARVEPLFQPMCRATLRCGAVPGALAMKFAVNIFLIASITGLAEAAHFAEAQGLDMAVWGRIVDASQMASDISRVKVAKLLAGDFAPQAAIVNVMETNRLIAEAAREAGIPVPLMEACLGLYRQATALGLEAADMIAVTKAFDAGARG